MSLVPALCLVGASSSEVQAQKFEAVRLELDKLQNLLAALPPFGGRALQSGDISLSTTLRFVEDVSELLGQPGLLKNYPGVVAWLDWARGYPALAEGCDEMPAAFAAFLKAMREG